MGSTTILQTNHLTKRYKEVLALDDLSLSIKKNAIFGFLGPNGAGKTTTMKLLMGLIQPTAGDATVFGMDILDQSLEIRSRIGYLPQNPNFYTYLSARKILALAAKLFYQNDKELIQNRIEESLELVGLADKADRPIKGFSGGEMQRLGIAQAQINQPDLLILDEPAASLDPMGRRDVLKIIENLQKTSTILYSTHILADVERVATEVAIIHQGRLIKYGELHEILGSTQIVYAVKLRAEEQTLSSLAIDMESVEWINAIHPTKRNGVATWHIDVQGHEVAEKQLLRVMLENQDVDVLEFYPKQQNLEEAFIELVGGN